MKEGNVAGISLERRFTTALSHYQNPTNLPFLLLIPISNKPLLLPYFKCCIFQLRNYLEVVFPPLLVLELERQA